MSAIGGQRGRYLEDVHNPSAQARARFMQLLAQVHSVREVCTPLHMPADLRCRVQELLQAEILDETDQ